MIHTRRHAISLRVDLEPLAGRGVFAFLRRLVIPRTCVAEMRDARVRDFRPRGHRLAWLQ